MKVDPRVNRTVLLGPKIDLHVGVHNALTGLRLPDFQHRRHDCLHVFVMANEKDTSPFAFFHLGEFLNFGPGQGLIHTARWPVLNRGAWVTDTDDFTYPVMCGRHCLDAGFRESFRRKWVPELEMNIRKRIKNMLAAYVHPSCKSILYHSEFAVRDARRCLDEMEAGELGETYLSKVQVLYPAQEPCPAEAIKAKWSKRVSLTVVFCGRDYETKNGRITIDIFSRLAREMPRNRFVYIGNIPADELRRSPELLGRVEYYETLPHKRVLSILAEAHVLFHPSKFEGLGIVFLEASAAGLAIITAKGGAMEPVDELFGKDGALLVDRNSVAQVDEAAAFESHLRHMLGNPDFAKRMAFRNFKMASAGKCSMSRSRAILSKVYQEALQTPAPLPLTLGQLPYRNGRTLMRFSSRQLEEEEWTYRRKHNVTEVRFLL